MLIKPADDKSKRVQLLESLQSSPNLDASQKKWAREELFNLQRGIQGERDAAHYIDAYFAPSMNHVVIHDLRLVVDDEVTQIDHLLIDRTMEFFLLETKCFNGNIKINEQGEFSVTYSGQRTFGVPSPIEQSKRHERALRKVLEWLGISGRLPTATPFRHAVLMHPKATISRPPAKSFDTSMVIKADQFHDWHNKAVDRTSVLATVVGAANFRSTETLKDWGEQIARRHKPEDLLWLPDFMKPKQRSEPPAPSPSKPDSSVATPERKLICATCGEKITFPEGKFCWNNERRFGGKQYCRTHQAAFK